MSGRIVGEILDNAPTDLTLSELVVFMAVGEDARDRDRLARYSDVETLTHRTRLKPGTVNNALSELKARGLIIPQRKTTYRGGSGHQEYVVTPLTDDHRNATTRNGRNPR